jgi:hypothetical protein
LLVGEGIGDGENRDNGNGKGTKKNVVGRRRSTKGNTRKKIRRGKDNENEKNYIET